MAGLIATKGQGLSSDMTPLSSRWKIEDALIALLLFISSAALAALLLMLQPSSAALEAGLCFLFSIAAAGVMIFYRASQRQARVRIGEARFADLIDHAPDGILLVEPQTRKVRYANERAGKIFGMDPGLMQTGRITDVAIDPQPDGTTADALAREMELEVLAGRESSRIWLARRSGGAPINIEVRAIPLPGESGVFRVSVIDISERVALQEIADRAEAALRISEGRFRHLAEMSTDWYWETGLDDRFSLLEGGTDAEQAGVRKLIGCLPWEFQGLAAVEPPWTQILAQRAERQPYRQLLRYVPGPDGQDSARILEIIGEPVFDAPGQFGGYRGVARDITGRHQAEQRLAESEERFRRLTKLSSDWQWEQDAQFRFTKVTGWGNAEAANPEHYMGKCRWERDNMRPVGFTWEEHRRVLEAHQTFSHLVVEHTDSAGQRYYWAIRGEPVFGEDGSFTGYRGVGSDISQRFLTEAALAESAERYRKLVELSQEGVVIHDHGSIVYANPCLNSMLRVPENETLIGRDIADFFYPEEVPHFRQQQSLLRASGDSVPFMERRLRRWDGEWVEAEVAGSLVEHAGRPVFQTQIRDISARKWTEQEILRLNASLEQRVASRTAELSAANHELESFSYTVAHDLRAPLRAVDGYAQMLRIDAGNELSESALRDVNAISASARKMAQLIDGLLDFARLGRGGLGHQRIETSGLVAAVVRDAVPDGRVQINTGALPDVWGDAAMLRQVWINLIGNAVKFSAGKPAPVIHIDCRREHDELIFSVRDNGAGFDARYAGKLFGVFQRLHSAQEFEGTGVGLAIVKRIVERHGGRIWAEGESGQGAIFYYALPAARSTGAGGAAPIPKEPAAAAIS